MHVFTQVQNYLASISFIGIYVCAFLFVQMINYISKETHFENVVARNILSRKYLHVKLNSVFEPK